MLSSEYEKDQHAKIKEHIDDSSNVLLSSLFGRAQVRKLFRALVEGSISEFNPVFTAKGELSYPDAESISGADTFETNSLLEELSKQGIFLKEPASPAVKCPTCGTENAVLSLICPSCGATELISGYAFQHISSSCLHFDFESRFERRSGRIYCPKCSRPLDSDYLKSGRVYRCANCGEFTAKAKRLFTCATCQLVFETSRDPAIETYRYLLNPQEKELVEKFSFPLEILVDSINRDVYDAALNKVIKGKSGARHSFTILARRNSDGAQVAVDVVFAPKEVEPVSVLIMHAKCQDGELTAKLRSIIIAVPKLSEEAKKLARNYGIDYIEADDSASASVTLKEKLLSLPPKTEVARPNRRSPSTSGKRTSMDIMADVLAVAKIPRSKSDIMACANMSFEQCQKYLPALEKLGLLERVLVDKVHRKYSTTTRGREYLASVSGQHGSLADGERSIWASRRRVSATAS